MRSLFAEMAISGIMWICVGKESVTLVDMGGSLHSRKLRFQVSGNGPDNRGSNLAVFGGKSQGKPGKKFLEKQLFFGVISDDVCNYCKPCTTLSSSGSEVVSTQEVGGVEKQVELGVPYEGGGPRQDEGKPASSLVVSGPKSCGIFSISNSCQQAPKFGFAEGGGLLSCTPVWYSIGNSCQ